MRHPRSRRTCWPYPIRIKIPNWTPLLFPSPALGAIDSNPRTHSSTHAILSGYYRPSNPHQTTEHFPRSLQVHPRNVERGVESGKDNLLYFHLGNAARALQDAYRLDADYAKVPITETDKKLETRAIVENATKVLEARLAHLEKLATVSPDGWAGYGDDTKGFRIMVVDDESR